MDMQTFVTENRIGMLAEQVDDNPNMDAARDMDHWKVRFNRPDGARTVQLTTYFSMGFGHNGAAPEAGDVLDCLASDAAGVENARSFEDWADEYGYDEDSRKAERTYKLVSRQAANLKRFLGDELYSALLWNVERL